MYKQKIYQTEAAIGDKPLRLRAHRARRVLLKFLKKWGPVCREIAEKADFAPFRLSSRLRSQG